MCAGSPIGHPPVSRIRLRSTPEDLNNLLWCAGCSIGHPPANRCCPTISKRQRNWSRRSTPLDQWKREFSSSFPEREIDETEVELRKELQRVRGLPIAVRPLHSKLPLNEQQAALQPEPGKRKVVLATSIAESSLTVVGVCHVIDTLLSRQSEYDAVTRTETLLTKRIPQDSQKQRGGRERKGKYYALCAEGLLEHGVFLATTPPEIITCRFSLPLLRMIDLGLPSFRASDFDSLDKPPTVSVFSAKGELVKLSCIKRSHEPALTEIGKITLKSPALSLEMGVVLATAIVHQRYTPQLAKIAAIAEEAGQLLQNRPGASLARRRVVDKDSDHITLRNIFDGFMSRRDISAKRAFCADYFLNYKVMNNVMRLYEKIEQAVRRLDASSTEDQNSYDLRPSLFAGHVLNLAEGCHSGTAYEDAKFVCAKTGLEVPPSRQSPPSLQTAPWVCYSQCREDDNNRTLHLLTRVDVRWLGDYIWYQDNFYCPEVVRDLLMAGAAFEPTSASPADDAVDAIRP